MIQRFTVEDAKSYAAQEMEVLFRRVPFAREFHAGTATDAAYYRRHLIETVLRIRLNNEVDAYCLHKIASRNYKLGAKLAQYLAEELGHEGFFVQDIRHMGVDKAAIDATRPFVSTEKLIGYLYYAIDHDGPMATMVWNWFVEWYSDTYNKTITRKATEVVGDGGTRGFRKHIEFDDDHDHISLMFSTVELTVQSPGDRQRVRDYLKTFIGFIGEYFHELHDATLGRAGGARSGASVPGSGGAPEGPLSMGLRGSAA